MPLSTRPLSSPWFARPLILGIAVLLMLLAAAGVLGFRYSREREAARVSIEHRSAVLDALDRLRGNIADLESERRGYLLTLDPSYPKPYSVSDESVRDESQALQALVADDPLQSLRAAHLALIISAKLREMDDIAKSVRSSGLDAALSTIRSMDEIRSQIGQMVDHERFLLVDWQRRADALEQSETWVISTSVVIITVVAGAALAIAWLEGRRRRKAAEENLQLQSDLAERDTKIRRLFESSIIGMVVFDFEGGMIDANDAFLGMVGYSREDLISGRMRWTAMTPMEWRAASEQQVDELRSAATRQAFEKEYLRKDGSRVPVLIGSVALEGRRNEGVAFVLDLTERKRAEEALRERAQLLDLTHDTIFVRGMNDVISFWNRGAEQLYGWNKEEAFDQLAHELLRTIFPKPLEEITSELLNTGRWEGELVHMKRDGGQLTVASRWSLRQDERGRPIGILETDNDISERKRAEYLTGHVFESSPDSMCIIGKEYRLQRVNPVFERFWGKPSSVAVGMHLAEVIGAELFERNARPSLDRCFAGEEVSIADWYATPNGQRYRVVTHSPLRPDSHLVEAALVIARDFTDYAQASEALHEAQTQLAHVNRVVTMGQLAASIAHEVNQPLAAAVTNAYAALRWLDRHPPDLEEVRKALHAITKDGTRAGEVVGRIRDLIRKAPPRKQVFALNEAILEVIALTRSEIVKNGVSVQTQLADGLQPIRGDQVQLQQVILNLILNALEALSGVDEGAREVRISTSRGEPDCVLVTVRDSGPGLPPGTSERVFEAFYTTKPGGLGMGLSICRSIIEAQGGRLWVAGNVPRGTIFQFTLPAQSGPST